MSASLDTGAGATITFGTSGFSAELIDVIGLGGISRGSVDTTHFGTTQPGSGAIGGMTFIPEAFVDPGTMTLEFHLNPDDLPPVNGPLEQITMLFKPSGGDSTGASWVFNGFVTDLDYSINLKSKMTGTMTLKISGLITRTAGS